MAEQLWRQCPHYEEKDLGGEPHCRHGCEFAHGEWQIRVLVVEAVERVRKHADYLGVGLTLGECAELVGAALNEGEEG